MHFHLLLEHFWSLPASRWLYAMLSVRIITPLCATGDAVTEAVVEVCTEMFCPVLWLVVISQDDHAAAL